MNLMRRLLFSVALFVPAAQAAELNLPDGPLFVDGSKTALVQIVMERDNKLFFEAYPTYEDINNDGVLDNRYKPEEIDYFGYFDSSFCYELAGGDHMEAVSNASDKKCSGSWSGDFLNYVTMTRMDILVRALYGGKRIIDDPTQTRLRRAFVPWENHTWGIEYTSLAEDGYLISDYTPFQQPVNGNRHLLATNNKDRNDVPFLRVRLNSNDRIWNWVDKERVQGDGYADVDLPLDVTVCQAGFLEEFCQQYPNGFYKPTGLLHEYGENNAMYFSLLTGSYENNLQGGVLRQRMASFGENEINPEDGTFTGVPGIVSSIDAIQIPNDFHSQTVQHDCGWLYNRTFTNGECRAWGNPIAEMMFEGMRYLAGELQPTPEFETSGGMDAQLGLESAAWDDPYSPTQPYAQCSSAYQLIVSDPSPSFDGDQLPGSYFGNFTSSSLGNLHVGDLADFISQNEDEVPGLKYIGEVGSQDDGTPTPKQVTTFRNIRGQAPEAPHREGSYYAPSVAYYGSQNDLHDGAPGVQNVGNFTLALGSPLPSIDVEVAGNTVSFAPFGKTVQFCGITTAFKPTNAIVNFTVENVSATEGSFRVSFEDMEQGADNDQDAVVRYKYSVAGGKVTMDVESLTAAGCAIQHLGYVVSGTTQDGVYLVVRDEDTNANNDPDFNLDVPPNSLPGLGWSDGEALPLYSSIEYQPSDAPAAEALKSPLWYAAKWGGFEDINADGIPQKSEWDSNEDGLPDNYFPVTDPSRMVQTMRTVFDQISEAAGAASSVVASAGSLKLGNQIYRSFFTSGSWTGDVVSQTINDDGTISGAFNWSANDALEAQIKSGARNILTYNPDSKSGVPFQWPAGGAGASDSLSQTQVDALSTNPITDKVDNLGESRLNYIRGEEISGFRNRSSALGDVIRSSPALVGAPSYFYPDDWGTGAPENAKPYSDFREQYRDRDRVVYVGANDGMLHAFDAGSVVDDDYSNGTGRELFAYIPSPVYPQLPDLTEPKYGHKFFVDATPRINDVFINGEWRTVLVGGLGRGGQGIYALDITDPNAVKENNAEDSVLWEYTDQQSMNLGYTYSSPVIARMANGKWNAIIANGYNNSTNNVGYKRGNGSSRVIIVDLETGKYVMALRSNDKDCVGSQATPNGMADPTAVDLDGDKIVDVIYAGDLYGCVFRYDVSSSNKQQWKHGTVVHKAVDSADNPAPITSGIVVGSHPSGEGVMLYFGTGKYLEPSDQLGSDTAHRIYGLWDKLDGGNTEARTRVSSGNLLEQYILKEESRAIDSTGDGIANSYVQIRTTTQELVDWSKHEGFYMDLMYGTADGEQVVATPLLRDGKILVNTHIPEGNECVPQQNGWLMVLDARSGSMLSDAVIDLDGDGKLGGSGADSLVGGVKNIANPFASPTIVSGENYDHLLSQDATGSKATSTILQTSIIDGRLSWRELEP